MKLEAVNLGKRFNKEWIFRNLSYTFEPGKVYAIVGPNGSGKSTLLKILWGQLPPSTGEVMLHSHNSTVPSLDYYTHVAIATPYMELIDEFSLVEMVSFHFKFKKPIGGLTVDQTITRLELDHARNKFVGAFSSGMKQRLKLGLAFFSSTELLFLDEPSTNLDEDSSRWYHALLKEAGDRVILIASNQPDEYPLDAVKVDITSYK
jgi:ABC-type multidrug transport system ATPase subunit